jgi:HTH-type transcriptional regulator/antitoxin HigA
MKSRRGGVWRSGEALILLGLDCKSDAQLWVTVFHEAAHLWLHGKREVFIDGEEETSSGQIDLEEEEAQYWYV